MEEKKKFITLKDLEVYQLSRELSRLAWEVYQVLEWQDRKIMGDQFIESTDSVGANIAEGYGRYHYLDKAKFYYNARASLAESCDHWLEVLFERSKISKEKFENIKKIKQSLAIKLNKFIESTFRAKEGF